MTTWTYYHDGGRTEGDDLARQAQDFNAAGDLVATRPYTADENAAADQAAAAAALAVNEAALRNGLQAAIDAALARQAAYQAVIDTPNATIKTNPAPYVVDLARQGKRSERALIRLIRLVGGLTTTADTGTN